MNTRTHAYEIGDRVQTRAMAGDTGLRYGEIIGVQEDSEWITVLWDDTRKDSRVFAPHIRMEQP